MNEPVEVSVPCNCEGSPHEADTVYLAAQLGLEGGLAVEAAMSTAQTQEQQTVAVSLALVRNNILGWTFTDAEGQLIPVTASAINRMLPYARGGEEVANRAASLYLEDAFGPLAERVRVQSRGSRTNGKTRPILAGHAKPQRKRSASSSPPASAGKP